MRALLRAATAPDTAASTARAGDAATLSWSTAEGHRGTCSVDAAGRLVGARVESFPVDDAERFAWQGYPVTCESKNGARQECAIRAPSQVEIERRLSRAECVVGTTWGASGTTVWVDGGCRAVFRVTPVEAWAPYTVRCDSDEGRRRECEIRAGGRVRLLHQESRAECVQGRSWGYRETELWVDRGCRGVFEVTAGGSWGSDYDRGRDACLARVTDAGMALLQEVGSFQDGHFYDFELDLDRQGVRFELRCRYDTVTEATQWLNR